MARAAWYPDPTRPGMIRYWDGTRWTAHRVESPLGRPPGPTPLPAPATATGWFPDVASLRWPAAILAIAVVVTNIVGNSITAEMGSASALRTLLGLGLLVLYAVGFPLTAWYCSRRWGSGRLSDDLGLRATWADVPLGFGGAIGLTVIVIVMGIVVRALGLPAGSNLTGLEKSGRNGALFLVLGVVAGVIAPVVEELLFRGVMLRGLRSKLAWPASVAAQAAVFGSAHFLVGLGWGNVGLIVVLGSVGVGLGLLARATGRLAAGMIAHSLFNIGQLTLLWFTLKH